MQSDRVTLQNTVEDILQKSGKVLLSRDEIMVLACKEIIRSVSYEEKNYGAGPSCEKS